MKRILLFLLLFAGFASLQAQEAFYIYRNDGDFDGFFFDQVERMGYSKFDLDSLEHNEYVVQEVQTLDSLYRIPLAAIDSIGFQQPEIILNPALKILDDLGYAAYFEGCGVNGFDERVIEFSPEMPESMDFEVGDVVVGLDESIFRDTQGGNTPCSGKVKEKLRSSWHVIFVLEPLSELSDVFVQFISVEQVGYDEQGNVRRRMAGMRYGEKDPLRPHRAPTTKGDGNYDISLINFSGTLQKEWKPTEKSSVTVALNLGAELKLSMVYNITWTRFFVKLIFGESFEVGAGVKAAIETNAEEDFPFGPQGLGEIPFPASLPLFSVKPLPEAFIRTKGELSAQVNFPKFKWGSSQTIIFDNKAESFMRGYLTDQDVPSDDEEELFTGTSGGIVWNGFFQTGIKEEATVHTSSWFDGIFYASYGMEIYAGPKLEGEVNLSVDGLTDSGAYGLLKDSKIEYSAFSIDLENKARMQYLWHDPEERTFWSSTKKFGTSTWYLFPEFKKSNVSYDSKTATLTAIVHPRRQVFWKSWIGAGVYNEKDIRVAERFNEGESYNLFNSFNNYTAKFTDLPAGHMRVVPLIRTLGAVMPAWGSEEEIDVPPYIKLEVDSVVAKASGDIIQVPIETNGDIVVRCEVVNSSRYEKDPVYTEVIDAYYEVADPNDTGESRPYVTIICEDNSKAVFGRDMHVVLLSTVDGLTARDTIKVYQPGGSNHLDVDFAEEFNMISFIGKGYYDRGYNSGDAGAEDEIDHNTNDITDGLAFLRDYEFEGNSCKMVDGVKQKTQPEINVTASRNGNKLSIHRARKAIREGWIRSNFIPGSETWSDEIDLVVDVTRWPGCILSFDYAYEYNEKVDNFQWEDKGSSSIDTYNYNTTEKFTCSIHSPFNVETYLSGVANGSHSHSHFDSGSGSRTTRDDIYTHYPHLEKTSHNWVEQNYTFSYDKSKDGVSNYNRVNIVYK